MSASSSSDCECDLHYKNYRTHTPIQPLYPELGRPLIYYAQVQRTERPQQSGKTKNNCFIKAFRWYTEEHVPLKKIESGTNNEDIQGFAAWLDKKYDEYIQKSQMAQITSSQYLLKPTSSVRVNNIAQNVIYATSVSRKNKMKSPWRRRQKYKTKQNGDTMKKSEQSIEFLLNPKNLSRSASEFCQRCRRSNNAITIDANTAKSKSESIIYILKEKAMYVEPSDDNDTVTDRKVCNFDKKNIDNGQSKVNRPPTKDISCQCSNLKFKKVDASSQFSHTKTSNMCDCVTSYTTVANDRINCLNTCCPCIDSQTRIYQKILIEEPKVPPSTVHPTAMSQKSLSNIYSTIVARETSFFVNKNIEKNERSFPVNGIAQTSDHAINLSNLVNPGRPIIFKIICTDK